MDTTKRLTLKALTWQVSGFVIMTLIGLAVTGSFKAGGGIAALGAVVGFGTYFCHELIWSKIKWGRTP